jgi:hypothetical protein
VKLLKGKRLKSVVLTGNQPFEGGLVGFREPLSFATCFFWVLSKGKRLVPVSCARSNQPFLRWLVGDRRGVLVASGVCPPGRCSYGALWAGACQRRLGRSRDWSAEGEQTAVCCYSRRHLASPQPDRGVLQTFQRAGKQLKSSMSCLDSVIFG